MSNEEFKANLRKAQLKTMRRLWDYYQAQIKAHGHKSDNAQDALGEYRSEKASYLLGLRLEWD